MPYIYPKIQRSSHFESVRLRRTLSKCGLSIIFGMGIFADIRSAEEFAANDPFVLNGIAKNILIKEWMD